MSCKGRSCLTSLLEFFEDINQHGEHSDPVDTMYLDFQGGWVFFLKGS